MTTPQKPRRRPSAKPAQPYHWFQGASVRTLVQRLTEANPDTCRLEVRITGTGKGEKMTFRVIAEGTVGAAGAGAPDDINDSRRCPPIC